MNVPKKYQDQLTYEKIEYNPRYRVDKKGKRIKVDQYKAVFAFKTARGVWDGYTKSCPKKPDAKRWLTEQIKIHAKKGETLEHRELTFRKFAEEYKTEWLSKLKYGKAEKAKVDLMVGYFGDTRLASIRRAQLVEFKKHLETTPCEGGPRKGQPRQPRGVDGYLMRLRDLLNYAETKEYITAPSFKDGLLTPNQYVKRTETISFDEFLRLIAACDIKKSGYDRKSLKIVLIGLHQLACRREELQQIKVKDVDLENRIIKVWEGKRKGNEREQRDSYISDILLDAILESGVLTQSGNTPVFGTTKDYKKAFKTAKTIAGIDDGFRLNDLRRTGITNMVQSGMTLPAIQKQVGHKANSAMTYDIYTKLSPEFIRKENQKVESYYRELGSENYRDRIADYRMQMENIVPETAAVN